jgi:Erg28 like protein
MLQMLDFLIVANGVYDILCAVGILFLPNTPVFCTLARLHPTMFKHKQEQNNAVLCRFLAYWLLTYGAVRIATSLDDVMIDYLAAITYFIEAAAFEYENVVFHNTQRSKVTWVTCSCMFLGICMLQRKL